MCSALAINKENINIVINTILWYGSGCHGRCIDINVQVLMRTFDCDDYNSIQAVYNALTDYQLEIKYEYPFIKCLRKLTSAPIKECRKNIPLAIRAILYSLQYDNLAVNDIEESIRNEYE